MRGEPLNKWAAGLGAAFSPDKWFSRPLIGVMQKALQTIIARQSQQRFC